MVGEKVEQNQAASSFESAFEDRTNDVEVA
jgi:hypothetical protein